MKYGGTRRVQGGKSTGPYRLSSYLIHPVSGVRLGVVGYVQLLAMRGDAWGCGRYGFSNPKVVPTFLKNTSDFCVQ